MGLSKPGSRPIPFIDKGMKIPSLVGQDRPNVTRKVTYELETNGNDPFEAVFNITTNQAINSVNLARLEEQHKEVVELLNKQLFISTNNDTTINNNLNTVINMLQDITNRLDALEGNVNSIRSSVG